MEILILSTIHVLIEIHNNCMNKGKTPSNEADYVSVTLTRGLFVFSAYFDNIL